MTNTYAPRSPFLPRTVEDYGPAAVEYVADALKAGESPYCDMSDESMTVWLDEDSETFAWHTDCAACADGWQPLHHYVPRPAPLCTRCTDDASGHRPEDCPHR